jgi:hypothetical protein
MRHLQVKSCSANMDGLSTSHSEGILHHNPHHRDPSSGSLTNLKRSSAEVEVITSPRSPMGKESMVTLFLLFNADIQHTLLYSIGLSVFLQVPKKSC